ncbi:TBC1 domain family member 22A [Salpingoeca rosetta]|uniref:TBC1 domain family member 22A n=1 Tax=Salpingoeca rosetta (strain ATCC 50818 / BSB-021) TaxID=946362 RepID=F2UFM1_SALR5|nr:TBC1 domain family member 22A [Salpingoeca rosetta]EGD75589.1 TBC1 domain family member 22A [Salpingoeca rosetta]|eukprot:XP_004992046.1 TBC1 domain family member 22A [Salpingoeca rosetta]
MTSTPKSFGGGFWKKRADGSPSKIRAVTTSSKRNGFQDFDDDMSEAWSVVEDDLILSHTPTTGPSASSSTGVPPPSRPHGASSASPPAPHSSSSLSSSSPPHPSAATQRQPQTSSSVKQTQVQPQQQQQQQQQPAASSSSTAPHAAGHQTSQQQQQQQQEAPQSVLQTGLLSPSLMPAPPADTPDLPQTPATRGTSARTTGAEQQHKDRREGKEDGSEEQEKKKQQQQQEQDEGRLKRQSSNSRVGVVPGSVMPVTRFTLPGEVKSRAEMKIGQFEKALNSGNIDIERLKRLSWSGVPSQIRPMVWRLLCGYLPANLERRQATLERKREEYKALVHRYYDTRHDAENKKTFHQIQIDVPRTSPDVATFQQPVVQEMLERILYIWAIRHPGSGYVQGMNDLVTPFIAVFIDDVLDCDFAVCDVTTVPPVLLADVEADSFWCLSRLLDGIQDNYTTAQPGIHHKIARLQDVIKRIDRDLFDHLESTGVLFVQFAFRWINCLLMRELPLHCTIRLWDTCLSEKDGFASFHVYVCAAFLKMFSKQLQARDDFQSLLYGLQNLPTSTWGFDEIELVLAEAFTLQSVFDDSRAHLTAKQ